MVKKIFKFTCILLLVLIGAAFAAPFLFKDAIVAKIKSAVNKNLYAKVDFSDVDISLFRHFPRISVALNRLQVTGLGEFSADTLMAAKNIDLSLNLISVIRGDHMKVYGVSLDSPRIHAIINAAGKANWNITKQDSTNAATTGASKPFNLELQQYAIHNGYISFTDFQNNTKAEVVNIEHEGSGDFTSNHFILNTKTAADALSVAYGGIPYLANATLNLDANIQVDNTTNTYTFETGNIRINNLKLFTKGFLSMVTDSTYNMDIAFNAPSTAFKDVLSLVPVIYKKDFDKVKANGSAVLNGWVKGSYGAGKIPAYTFNLNIKDGFFQYIDLPQPVKNINLAIQVNNPDGITDHTVVNIPNGHLEMDDAPFDFRLVVKNPVTDMFVDGAAKGKLDLSRISQFVKLESGTKLGGILLADVSVKGTIAAVQRQQYEQVQAAGTIAVNALQYAAKDYPDGIKVNNLFMTFNPTNVTISDLDGQYKKTNFSANGSIRNLLPYLMRNQTLGGQMNIKADNMNLNDWMGTSTDTSTKNTAAAAPFAVPPNLTLAVNAEADRVVYDKLEMQHLSGNLVVDDEHVLLNNIKGDALDGTLLLNGSYSTKENKKKPDIRLAYDVKGMDVQKTFYAVNTVQKLMPVGQYLSGRLSSQLSVTGKLGDNMMPDLNSLTGEGNLLLIEGLLKKFAPLEKLADYLNISELKDIAMKDVKNYISFTDGMVRVKPFTLTVKGIGMEISGTHGFNQSLDYVINLKIPRTLIGNKGNSWVNDLVTQANNKGIPVTLGETVSLRVDMGGTLKNPTFKTNLKEAASNAGEQLKQQALDIARLKIDSSKKAIKDTARSVQIQVFRDLQEEAKKRISGSKDSILNNRSSIDSSRKKIEAAGKGLLRGLLKKKSVGGGN